MCFNEITGGLDPGSVAPCRWQHHPASRIDRTVCARQAKRLILTDVDSPRLSVLWRSELAGLQTGIGFIGAGDNCLHRRPWAGSRQSNIVREPVVAVFRVECSPRRPA
jgi:hypothetical protein